MPFSPTLPESTIALVNLDMDASARHCQIRGCTDDDVVKEYAEAMEDGVVFPPVDIFTDGESFWLVDGFHRVEAAETAGKAEIDCILHNGTLRDATLFSVGVNARHGLGRTVDDKRRAVMTLLNDDAWRKWSARKIALKCGVSNKFVSAIKSSLSVSGKQKDEPVICERNGTTYEMQTANIGKPKDEPTPTPEESRPADDGDNAAAVDVEADEPAAYDELDHDEETPESFSDELPPPNKFGAFYDLVRERAKAVLSDAVHSDYYVVAGQLYAIAEELEGVAARMKEE